MPAVSCLIVLSFKQINRILITDFSGLKLCSLKGNFCCGYRILRYRIAASNNNLYVLLFQWCCFFLRKLFLVERVTHIAL